MLDLHSIANNIHQAPNGIYEARDTEAISYPDGGNALCMQLEEDSFWFQHRNEAIAALVAAYSPDAVFFDIGGGNGFVARHLQDQGNEVVLVEPGPEGARNAQLRNIRQIVCATLESAGFQHNSLDAIGMFDVVEHIEDDNSFLQNSYQFLKPGGCLYLTVPAYNWLWSKEDVDAGHFRRYTLRSMGKRLRAAGFEVEYSSYLFSILPLPILLFRSIPSLLGFNKKSDDPEKHKKEHAQKKGWSQRMLDRIWRWEIRQVRRKRRIFTGSSCLIVARKR